MNEAPHLTHIPKIPFIELMWWSKVPCMDHEIQRQISWVNDMYFCINPSLDTKNPIIGSYIVDMMRIPFVRSVWWWNIEGVVKIFMNVLKLINMSLKM